MTVKDPRFQSADYAVFVVLLVASSMVGIVQAIITAIRKKLRKGEEPEKKETVADARNLSVWPAALGVIGSSTAAPFCLGVPAEMYFYGTEFSLYVIGALLAVPMLAHLLYARLYEMKITTIYEYLEYRFNKIIRSMCSLLFIIVIIIYNGIITYAPATAFGQVTGVSVYGCIAIVGAIAIVYTSIGSLKETLWVDGVQMLVLLASVIAIIVQGTNKVGSISEVWSRAYNGGRIQFNVVDPNPLVRTSFWTQSIGGWFSLMVVFTMQNTTQKFLRQRTITKMYITAYFAVFAKCFYLWLFCLCGLVIYAYYDTCSPILTGAVADANSLLPYFVVDIFQDVPGVSGLFMVALFCACLSVIAACLNALSGITVLDAVIPTYLKITGKKMNTTAVAVIYKCLVVFYGLISTALGYAAPHLGPNVLTVVLNLASVVCGPMLALFIMGVYMPWVNSWGAGFGLILGVIFTMVLSIGALSTEATYHLTAKSIMKLSVAGCPKAAVPTTLAGNVTAGLFTTTVAHTYAATTGSMLLSNATNVTMSAIKAAAPTAPHPSPGEMFYYTSYMWYSLIAVLITVAVANIVTLISAIIARYSGFDVSPPIDPRLSAMCCYKETRLFEVKESVDTKEVVTPENYRTLPEAKSDTKFKAYDNNGFQNGKMELGISTISGSRFGDDENGYSSPPSYTTEDYPQKGGVDFENEDSD